MCHLSPASPLSFWVHPVLAMTATPCPCLDFSLQFFVVLLIILLAELILLILFFVYMDKVSPPGREGAIGISLPLGWVRASRRESAYRPYL